MSQQPILEVKNISFGYRKDKLVLRGVSLTVPAGARIALVGPNGAGKSTLFLHLNGILHPSSGQLLFKGEPYRYSRAFITRLRQKIGLVFQDQDTQLFAGSVLDDVLFGPMNLGLSPAEAEQRAAAALAAVQMAEFADEPVHFLSYGQKKRVAVAGVLAMDPEVLVMDEPTAGLDYPGTTVLRAILDELSRAGKTLIVATHDIEWVWSWADLVYVLVQGQIVAGGPPELVLNRSDHAAFGFARPLVGEIYSALVAAGFFSSRDKAPRSVAELVGRVMAKYK
ncbi:energy-coupling factor ABC transporter ATP-binding protein [Sporolituus thermophilus]|uniref:ABC transporter ATP-binding protein n=1 Tax=Sporolituus thermophilus DSM 23256 TaxID=1123285 RepID=A0A1G7HRK2_9FIRM|nr:ABC transporter ATP-binding protein [Sporolituus thermophilus]SDF02983.1 cobalt/nickel transport system ATP-binding protein [Sporolituus thermophilus DSM 23256]